MRGLNMSFGFGLRRKHSTSRKVSLFISYVMLELGPLGRRFCHSAFFAIENLHPILVAGFDVRALRVGLESIWVPFGDVAFAGCQLLASQQLSVLLSGDPLPSCAVFSCLHL